MVLLNVIVKPLWIFGIDRNVQLAVGNSNYGVYFALLNLTFVFSILLDLGLTVNSNRMIAADPSKIQNLFANVIWAKAFLMLVYFVILFICCFLFYNSAFYYKLIGLLALLQGLNSMLQYLRSNISANHNFKMDSLLSVLDKLIVIIICGTILLMPTVAATFSILHFAIIQILGYLIAIALALHVGKRYAGSIDFTLHFNKVWLLVKQGLPYTLVVLLMGLYTRSDGFILERLATDGQVQSGYYASIYRLLDTCNMLGYLFAGMLMPIFSRLIGNGKSVAELVGVSIDVLLPISIGVVGFSFFYRQEIMVLLTKENNAQHAMAFAILMCSFPALCLMNVYSTLLTANNNIKTLLIICALGALVSLSCNLFFIPRTGYMGAAIICAVVQWLVAILFIIKSKSIFQLPNNLSKIIKLTALALIMLMLNYGLKVFECSLLIGIVMNAMVFLGLVWLLQLWQIHKLAQYLSPKNV